MNAKTLRKLPKGADLSHIHPDMHVLAVPIAALSGHPDNPRKHPDANKKAIAGSLRKYLQRKSVVVNLTPEGLRLEAGHGVYGEMLAAGSQYIACTIVEDDPVTELGFMLADNRSGDLSEDDPEKLAPILRQLIEAGEDVEEIGWDDDAVRELLGDEEEDQGGDDSSPDDAPVNRADELQKEWSTARGQVWEIPSKTVPGKCHRVMCGDSTVASDVSVLMGDVSGICLLHADPPYGMGKESDGVANDNLYREKLDAFQMLWWRTWRPYLSDNASAYVWGNAPELWRLWYVGGLANSERLTLRNEIVWDKKHGQGMASDQHRMYPTATERCLFFMLGEQGFNNNADNYWEGWDSIVNYLRQEKEKTGWEIAKFKRLAGHSETSGCHWFDKSQWMMPTKEAYDTWQKEANGKAFKREYDDLKREYDDLKREYDDLKREYDDLKREFYATRAHFDNTHDNMTDVWDFPRVVGEDRHGHATPKPLALVERAVKSSCPRGGVVAEPFLGSGSTLVAAERVGRVCVGMELSEAYVAVILERARAAGLEPRLVNGL